ncbi:MULTISPECIES: hypothetical protein [unclassified Rhizobium]|uniref:hypothetical protein n=1 Tax=unclassified Rhizobium TaxID=2613769 RepID=UPI0007138179|nr:MULTISPECIES: hypothetical protein [unclassified Rhizobium]KQS90416.1 hypothetical protein ASG50_08200 [Rhizobium sp. Leaf386]KQS90679.1 hypothetical protein ASG42_09080 [Rhizobium sp. Leaf391]KQU10157.1 hypothetical protein ASG68_04070 [Rhizobium sp. Leaf453]
MNVDDLIIAFRLDELAERQFIGAERRFTGSVRSKLADGRAAHVRFQCWQEIPILPCRHGRG